MKHPSASEPSARETENTGLPWPRTWTGVYCFVVGSFILWVALLIALSDAFS